MKDQDTINLLIKAHEVIYRIDRAQYSDILHDMEDYIWKHRPGYSHVNHKLSLPIHVLGLQLRSTNCLLQNRVFFVYRLVKMTELGLLKMPNFGKISLKDVKSRLLLRDLSLGMNVEKEGGQ